jgi:tetratricopeptide (TPR) repeat protein
VLSNALNIVPINGKNINAVAYSEGAANAAIHGFLVMEKGLSMNALAVSMMHFNRSLELKPDYLRAQIGLCKGLVGLYLLRQTPNTLKSAEKSCNSLSESAARDIDYLLSMSTLMRSQRMLDEAKTFVDIALTLSANNVDSLLTAAETELRLLIQTQDKTHFKNAVDYIDLAIENEPTYWKPLFVKSRAYYFTGQIPKAIAYVRSSVELEENFNNLSNLATLNFCFGEAQQTKEYYLKASTSVYADSLIKYNLAAMYSYFEQYDLASYEMDKYLSDLTLDGSRGQIESLIGAGDIYLDNQEYQKAQSNYQQAFVGLEALLRVSPEALDLQLLQLHSEIGLASLPNNNIDSQNATLVSKLDEIQSQLLDPINQVRILLLYISLDEIDKARLIYPKIVPVCKGFAESPRIVAALGI